jgi:sugar lactone lactonase YvrE
VLRALLASCIGLTACQVPDYNPVGKRCDVQHACPDPLECVVGTCVKACTRPAAPCSGAGCAETLAGSGSPGFQDGAPDAALFRAPTHLIALPSGDLIVSDSGNNALRLIPLDGGAVTTLASSARACDYSNVDALCQPRGLAKGADGALYVVSYGTNIVHRIANGQVKRLIGDGTPSVLNRPTSLAAAGSHLVVTDSNNCQLLFFDLDGGQSGAPLGGCNTGIDGRTPWEVLAVAVSPDAQTVYFIDGYPSLYSAPLTNGLPSGAPHRLNDGPVGFTDGPLQQASFAHPTALAADAMGVFVSDEHNNRIRYAQVGGNVMTLAGDGNEGVLDGTMAFVSEPGGVAALNGDVFFTAPLDHRIRRIHNGSVDTVAGGSPAPLADGCSDSVKLVAPTGLDVDPSTGVVLFTDALHHAVRAMARDGAVVTITGGTPGSQDGDFASAQLNFPGYLRWLPDGGVVVADTGNGTLRQLDFTQRKVTTLAGVPHASNFRSATCVTRLDQLPSTAVLCNPAGVAVASTGEIYFGDAADDGTGVIGRLSADRQRVDEIVRAQFTPRGLTLSPTGTLVTTDASGHGVLEYDLQGNMVRTVVAATDCSDTADPSGVGCDPADVLYSGNTLLVLYRFTAVLRAFPASGPGTTLMGTAFQQGLSDGTSATLMDRPLGLALAADGTVLIADSRNNRLRRLTR